MTLSPDARGLGRRLARNTLHAASGRVVSLAVWLFLAPVVLRGLGTDGFAVWSLFFALTGWLGAFDLGLGTGALRFVAAARARGDHAEAGEHATLALLGYAALGLLWLALAPLVRAPVLDALRIPAAVRPAAAFAFTAGAGVFALNGMANVTQLGLQACGRFDLANVVAVVVSLSQALGIVIALRLGAGLPGVVTASGVAWLAATVIGGVSLRAGVPDFHWASPRASWRRARDVLHFGGPLQLANALAVAHQQVDKLLLSRFVRLALATPYDLGLRLATVMSSLPQLLLVAVAPAAAALEAQGESERLRQLYRRSHRYVLAVTALPAAALIGAGPRLVAAWLGRPYPLAALATVGLTVAAVAAMSAATGQAVARAVNHTRLEAEFTGLTFAVHLALGLALVPRFGLAGAVAITAGANVIGASWFALRLARTLRWPVADTLAPALVASLAIGVGALAGRAAARALPPGHGAAAWGAAIVDAAAAVVPTALTLGLARFVSVRELASLARAAATGGGAA